MAPPPSVALFGVSVPAFVAFMFGRLWHRRHHGAALSRRRRHRRRRHRRKWRAARASAI